MESFRILVLYLVVPSVLISVANAIKNQILQWRKEKKPGFAKFPGPKQFPVVGRVHDLPRFGMWKKLKEWGDEFGPIFQTRMLGQKFIIISDEKLAQELLIKRGHIYSGRPQIRALIDHKLGPTYSALMDRHEIWKGQRKWVHAAMAAAYQNHFYGHIEEEVKRWLAMILLDPERFHDLCRELTGRVMSRMAWDDASQGPLNGQSALTTLRQMSVSGPIVNTMSPIWDLAELVRYNPWRKFEVERERNQKAWWLQLFRVAKTRFQRGELPDDTWTYRYFEQLRTHGNPELELTAKEEEYASCMLGFQCLVGVVTVSGPLQFFLMAMSLHPEWQKKAQEEIDRVCGDRMPDAQDWPNLPTVRACLKETLRWRSGVPLGVPHQCEQDDVFRGVEISKGTIILACEWSINRVPEMYPDPENYHPERWLEPSWPTYQEPLTRYPSFREGKGMHTFGWGRRTCLGQNVVEDEMFIAGAGVLWAFDLLQKTCPCTGKVVEFDSEGTSSAVILEPLPFPMSFKPRSKERQAQILKNYDDVRDVLRV